MSKFRIQVIDFLPQFGQHPTDLIDQHGKPLCLGACVHRNDGLYLIGQRYGKVVLLPTNGTALYLGVEPGSQHNVGEKTEVVAVPGLFLIVDHLEDPLWEKVRGTVEAEVNNGDGWQIAN